MMKKLWTLFWTFAKVGVMTFGGGYAMLPILQREVVEKKGWATDEELTDYFAIGQCTPGVIAVNTATFVGQKHVLIFNAVLKLVKGAMKDAWCWGIFGVILVLSLVIDVSPILYVVAAGLAGVVLQAVKGREKK